MRLQINRQARRARKGKAITKKNFASLARFAVALLFGCPKPVMVAGNAPEAAALYEQAKKAHAVPLTLACDAKAFVEAPHGGGRYSLHVSVERPRNLRIEALTPLGDPAAVLVAHQ